MFDPKELIHETIRGYWIKDILGRGGMAVVYGAQNRETGIDVALKMACPSEKQSVTLRCGTLDRNIFLDDTAKIIKGLKEDSTFIGWKRVTIVQANKILEHEASVLARLRHPLFVRMLDEVDYYGLKGIVLEYIPGETLGERMSRIHTLPISFFITLIDALLAMQEEGLECHGDLKPANIMLRSDSFESFILIDPVGSSPGEPMVLTPAYNPGLLREDIMPIGVMLYEEVTGIRPYSFFRNNTWPPELTSRHSKVRYLASLPVGPSALNPAIPAALEQIILNALHQLKDGNRYVFDEKSGYQTLQQLREDLVRFQVETGFDFIRGGLQSKSQAILRAIQPYLKPESPDIGQIVRFILERPLRPYNRALSPDPSDRYANGAEFMNAMRKVL